MGNMIALHLEEFPFALHFLENVVVAGQGGV
jgi:hypothetical protein